MVTSTPHSSETSQVITIQLCMFDYVREMNTFDKFGCNPPARGRSTNTWNIHFLWLLPSCLPAFLFFSLRTCTGQTDRDNFTHSGSKDTVWRKEVPSQQVFHSHLTFWGSFCPQNLQNFAPAGKSMPNKKSRITSEPFKINITYQLNMNLKSGTPFRIRNKKITWSAP